MQALAALTRLMAAMRPNPVALRLHARLVREPARVRDHSPEVDSTIGPLAALPAAVIDCFAAQAQRQGLWFDQLAVDIWADGVEAQPGMPREARLELRLSVSTAADEVDVRAVWDVASRRCPELLAAAQHYRVRSRLRLSLPADVLQLLALS